MSRLIRRIFDGASKIPSKHVRSARRIHTMADLKARLLLQPLEDRMVPSNTYTVSLLTDTGSGSSGSGSGMSGDLRFCIAAANTDATNSITGDTINFGVTGAINLTSVLPTITAPGLSITGPGSSSLTIARGTGTFRIMTSTPGAGNTLSISGVTISGGNSGSGAGIDETNGNLTLTGVVVQGNDVTAAGGGVANASTGTLTISGCTIQNNSGGSGGGGILNSSSGALTITNSTIQNNTGGGGGGISNASGPLMITGSNILNNRSTTTAGGIFNSSGTVTLTGDTISGNSSAGFGGGMENSGTANMTVTNSNILSNTTSGANSAGGGLALIGGGSLTMTGSTISGNTCGQPANGGGGALYFGGTVVTPGGFTISNSTIANNVAVNGGGLQFGGLNTSTNNSPISLVSDTIAGNTATNANAFPGLGGGGIGLRSTTTTAGAAAAVTLDNTIVSGNTAVNGFNAISATPVLAPLVTVTVSAKYSAIDSTTGFTLTDQGHNLIGSNLLLGPLSINGGSTQTVPLLAASPAIGVGDPSQNGVNDQRGTPRPAQPDIGAYERVANTLSASATVSNVTSSASATYQFTVNYADDVPITISSITGSNVTITAPNLVMAPTVTLASRNSSNPDDVVATYQFTAPGGTWTLADNGFYTVNMVAGQVSDANGSVPAGPLATFLAAVPTTFTVTDTLDDTNPGSLRYAITQANTIAPYPAVIVFSNTTNGGTQTNFYDGGVHTITLGSALPTIANSLTITGPGSIYLTIAGGAFQSMPINPGSVNANFDSTFADSLSGLTLTGAKTATAGAAIGDTNAAALTLTDVTIKNNSTSSNGGAISLASAGTALTLTNSTVQANTAGTSGGGINFVASGVLTLSGDTISSNSSNATGGGGIYAAGGTIFFTMTNTTVANNTAGSSSGAGGGIDAGAGGSVVITDSTISGNSALSVTSGGGGLFLYGGSAAPGLTVTVSNSTIANNYAVNGGGIEIASLADTSTPISLVSDTITGNTAANANAIFGLGGGGIGLRTVTSTAGATAAIAVDNTIVSGNTAVNGFNSISAATASTPLVTVTVSAKYSAIGSTTGFALTDQGNNLIGYNLLLGPLGSNGGSTQTVPLLAASTAIGVGDPALVGTTDQRGTSRPQQMGPGARPDIGAYERAANTLSATATVSNVTSASAPATYQFTVNYADDVPITLSSITASNVTITPPGLLAAPMVTLAGINSSNPDDVVATYQFTAAGSAWTLADNGFYTVNMMAGQVSDANGSVPAGPLATFLAEVPTTYTVTDTLDDTNPGSLRYAITQANLIAPNPAVIVFSNTTNGGTQTNFYDGTAHTITLGSALPAIANNLTITGPGSTVLTINRTAGTFQLMPINPAAVTATNGSTFADSLSGFTLTEAVATTAGAAIGDTSAAALTLTDVTIKNNSTSVAGGGINLATAGTAVTLVNSTIQANTTGSSGGGINFASSGQLTVSNSTITSNTAATTGGGVSLSSGTNSYVTVKQSTLSSNKTAGATGNGGGLFLGSSGSLLIDHSTLSGNLAGSTTVGGGAIELGGTVGGGGVTIVNSTIANNTAINGGGIATATLLGQLNIISSTITGNSATSGSGTVGHGGGGISLYSASTTTGASSTISLDSTIVSGNNATNGNSDIAATATGTAVAVQAAYSALGTSAGYTLTSLGNNLPTGSTLNLQSLAPNGGPTQTIAFSVGSALLNAGDPTAAGTTDQRGDPRVVGPAQDIGAYEYDPITIASVQVNGGAAQRSEVTSITVTFSGAVSFAGGNAAAAFQLQHVQDTTNVANLAAAVSTNGSGQTVVTLTFTATGNSANEIDPESVMNGGAASLADGRYQMTVSSSAVSDAALGWALDGEAVGTPGDNYVSPTDTQGGGPGQVQLYRIFGDTDGSGIVDQLDLATFRGAFNSSSTGPTSGSYLAYLDADNSGVIDQLDLAQFRGRFNASVFRSRRLRGSHVPHLLLWR